MSILLFLSLPVSEDGYVKCGAIVDLVTRMYGPKSADLAHSDNLAIFIAVTAQLVKYINITSQNIIIIQEAKKVSANAIPLVVEKSR